MTIGGDSKNQNNLPVILIAAVVQGVALYALHASITGERWPATQPSWLLGLYAVATFAPLTVQLLAEHVRSIAMWIVVGGLAALLFCFGWFHGATVLDADVRRFLSSGRWFPLALLLSLWWLLLTPFIQAGLTEMRWRASYGKLFSTAWRNKLTLAEAGLFTGLFWLLLLLWAQLFKMLGMQFFSELFSEPVFAYPVTALVFGFALHLIGSVERLTGVVLEQLLNVLKWLAPLAGLILTLFTVALAFRLPDLISSGERAISAASLLWLVAVMVLLVNAAYRDGSVDKPYPTWIALAMRCVIPLLVVIALVALYAIYLRIQAHGFTVERVWAGVAAVTASLYAIGYALATRTGAPWMAGAGRVNVLTACFLIVVIGLALTPMLSPYRISADSQFRLAQESVSRQNARAYGSPLHYLRFNAGEYGAARLRELSNLQDHPFAAQIREDAAALIAQEHSWSPARSRDDLTERLAGLRVHPSTHSIDEALMTVLQSDLGEPGFMWGYLDHDASLAGLFVDLNADGVEEFVLTGPSAPRLYEKKNGQWRPSGRLEGGRSPGEDLSVHIARGDVEVRDPSWRELRIGKHVFQVRK